MRIKSKEIVIWTTISIVGALLGYAYYYFIGCKTGNCKITSNWFNSTIYGFIMGFLLGIPDFKKMKKQKTDLPQN